MRHKLSESKGRLHLYIDLQVKEEINTLAKRFRLTPSAVVSVAVSKLFEQESKSRTLAVPQREDRAKPQRNLTHARPGLRRRIHSD